MKTLGYQVMKEISVNFNNVMKLEALVNFARTLNVEGTVNLRISRMGEGMTEIKTQEHPDEIAKKTLPLPCVCLDTIIPCSRGQRRRRLLKQQEN